MEWKSNLWRTQSLKSLPSSCDKPTWTEEGLWDKKSSVSQLVARYQTTVEVSASIQVTSVNSGDAKPKQVLKEITPSLLENKETGLASLMRRNEERERSRAKSSLTRSKSMGSLQNGAGSIEALKALFESNAATQSKVKSSFRAANFKSPYKAADTVTVMNGEVEEVKRSAEEQKAKVPADAPVNDAKMDAKADHVTQKVVNNTRTERRKTIGGIDFEKLASSQADEKRRSIADFRDSSFIQTKEKLCVSVKAMSACYMSKVAPQEPTQSPLKLAQDQSSESGKRVKLTKMAEDSQKREDDLPPPPLARHQPGPEDISGAHSQQSMPAFSKEKLYQQRQKCELRRLLKHTHPEVKMLDEVVDEELAEVLSSETVVTAGETGYEGEVLSRRLIFENCALSNKVSPYTPKSHMADRTVDRGDVSKTSTVSEEHEGRLCDESVKGIVEDDKTIGSSPDPNRECEEEMIRIDVQATRRIFENQSVKTLKPNPDNKFQGKVSISRDETGPVQKQIHDSEVSSTENIHCENKRTTCTKSLDLIDQPHKQGPCVHVVRQSTRFSGGEEVSSGEAAFEDDLTSLSGPEEFEESITTSVDLLKNNPFISTNIERENSYVHELKSQIPENPSGAAEEYLVTNVKNRAYLFESLPFDRIRHQNKDEIETLVENIKETLNSLYHVNAIHSGGSIIEVNETMIAKKAKFTLSEGGPKINYDEVAEGGAQNFILQLLPRANLKPQITYLKEDSKGSMKATVVNVPVAQHQFPTSQDTEFKTANVVQLVEDILNQDNSLRKGVIIQKDANTCAEVIVYSLYNYFDEDDVKSYSAPQGHAAEYDEPEMEKTDISKTENQGLRKGIIESAISCLRETSQDQICTGSIRPEVTVKGNVKLFKSCIEKGDLEYLKTLQAEPTVQEQELLPNQTLAEQSTQLHHELRGGQAEESSSEWVPVDVKRLKGMFSGDQRENQTKQNIHENCVQSTTILHPCTGQTVPLGKSQSSGERNIGVYDREQRKNTLWKCGGRGQEEVCNFTAAPLGPYLHLETQDDDRVHQAELVEVVDDTDEISNLQTAIHSLQQATMEAKSLYYSSQNKQIAGDVKHSRTEAELPQENENQKVDLCTEPRWDEAPSASNITSEYKSDRQHENTETCHEKTNSEEVLTTEICNKQGQKGTDVVHKHLEALVDSSKLTPGQQEEEEVVFHGKLQAALDSLERSNINIARGDFKAAMIYRNSSKPHKERSQNVDALSVEKPIIKEFFPVTEPRPTEVPLRQEFSKEEVTAATTEPQSQSETLNKPVTSTDLEKSKKPVVSKPAIPPKPEHLKVKQRDNQSSQHKEP
ncbi:LIM domain-containing protein isoform X2 [Lates calcarifer]|nr:LIM domain-containing protein isoform X2 [Lates calcarifer]XP_018529306.1 LIM domain-containing protein isoform X2 [Lates calcarifer]